MRQMCRLISFSQHSYECPLRVNSGLSQPTAVTSAFGCKADIGGPLFRAGHIRLRFLLPSGEDLTFGRRRPGRHTLVSGILGPSQRSAGRFPAAAQARARESASKQLGICARGAQLEGMECSRRTAAVALGEREAAVSCPLVCDSPEQPSSAVGTRA